jgi:hypothetical protein
MLKPNKPEAANRTRLFMIRSPKKEQLKNHDDSFQNEQASPLRKSESGFSPVADDPLTAFIIQIKPKASPMVNPDSSAIDLSRAIHLKQVSCQEIMQSTLDRIARLNPQSNAIVSLQEPELLMAQARERDAQLARGESMGWMHGMPQAIKDLAHSKGLRTTLGSPLMKDFVASEDGLMVQRMKAAGAIVIGKTNTPE